MNLINRIDNYLLQKRKHKREAYYPSEINKCNRQLYYKWTETFESNPIAPEAYWKMRIGDNLHDMIHEFLKNSGLEIIPEVSFKKDIGLKYLLSGRIDDLFIDEDKELAGIEVKTSYGRGIVEIQKDGKPKQNDLNQVIIYLACNTEIKRFYLVYFGRDNAYRTQFIIERYDNLQHDFNNLIQKFYSLEYYINHSMLPDRPYLAAIKNGEIKDKFQKDKIEYKTDWECNYCVFKNYCWSDLLIKYKESDNSEMFQIEYKEE